jgi:uncharacterized protein YdeI (YjbR/CyaY-like superfamily)
LSKHHQRSPGIWLARWKKESGHPVVPYDDVVEEAIRFGWVDSKPRNLDEKQSLLLVTPRKPKSNWSRINKQRAEALIGSGRMTPAGLAAVEAAKANGAWDALNQVEDLSEPADLAQTLDADPTARTYWDAFPRSTRRAILEWIRSAKSTGTRQKRIDRTVSDAAVDIRANQWRQSKGKSERG